MNQTAHTLKVEYLDKQRSPNLIELRSDLQGETHLFLGFDDGVFRIPWSELRDVTGEPDEFRQVDVGLLVEVTAENYCGENLINPRQIHLRLVYDITAWTDKNGHTTTNAHYYSFGEDYLNDTEHNHLHLVQNVNRRHDPDQQYFLLD